MNSSSSSDGGMMMCFNNNNSYSYGRSPFTLSQWQELEHQALIFKYMVASLPVPPDLVLLIHNSFHSISQSFLQRPSVGYCSFYEKKVDPEPGRCRRTDGKKWRCSKEAHPASKYCERHMHRGRNRSRKLVESQTMAQSSSTLTSLTATGGSSGTGNFQNHPTNAFANLQASGSGTSHTKYQLDSVPCGIPSKEYRYLQGSNKVHQMESQLENTWPLMSTGVASFSTWKSSCNSMLQSDYPRHSFLSSEYASRQPVKQEDRPLRPFLNEWPKGRESWSGPEDERSNQTALPATQLSISSPMSSPDFSATCSQSPHGEI